MDSKSSKISVLQNLKNLKLEGFPWKKICELNNLYNAHHKKLFGWHDVINYIFNILVTIYSNIPIISERFKLFLQWCLNFICIWIKWGIMNLHKTASWNNSKRRGGVDSKEQIVIENWFEIHLCIPIFESIIPNIHIWQTDLFCSFDNWCWFHHSLNSFGTNTICGAYMSSFFIQYNKS